MSLHDLDAAFHAQQLQLLQLKKQIFDQLKTTYEFDLDKRDITDAVLKRMHTNWLYNDGSSKLLSRSVNPPAADYFTESCLFFLKAYFEGLKEGYEVHSERPVNAQKSRRIVKPDISIWQSGQLAGVIELKTLNDWFRHNWKQQLEEREAQVKAVSGRPNLFFAVVAHWNFFDMTSSEFNQKYFGLLNRETHLPTNATLEKLIKVFKATQQ